MRSWKYPSAQGSDDGMLSLPVSMLGPTDEPERGSDHKNAGRNACNKGENLCWDMSELRTNIASFLTSRCDKCKKGIFSVRFSDVFPFIIRLAAVIFFIIIVNFGKFGELNLRFNQRNLGTWKNPTLMAYVIPTSPCRPPHAWLPEQLTTASFSN